LAPSNSLWWYLTLSRYVILWRHLTL
jgi:hypothetical protein